MIIEQTFTVDAPPAETAAFFLDIDRVSACIPGVEGVKEVSPGEYEATLGVRLGPIKAAFTGSIALDDTDAPERLRANGQGRDRATNSSVKVDFTADLTEEQPGTTTVRAVADLTIRGKLSQFGTGVMRAAAGEIVREFAACANDTLTSQRAAPVAQPTSEVDDESAPSAARAHAPAQRGMVSIVARGVLRSAAGALRGLADRIETRLDAAGPRA